ncbi:EpsG family protein [Virgibacillus sp. W0430]|uniref:EpsG family protein n=1 Tax=Virgibacillus sp. W0430 TaxID=3391580 RepID=UPI003F446537
MTIFWINLTIVFFFSFLARYYAIPSRSPNAVLPIKPNKLLIFFAFLSLTLVSGLRANIGDTYFYIHSFKTNDFTWESILVQKDIGFGLLQLILKNYVSEDPQVLIFITALLTNLFLVIVLYRYSRLIEISLYVYITGGLFLVSMNGIRQVLAAAIAYTAIRFLIGGNFIAYSFIIIVASLFHQSALVLIPIYFLVRYKAWSKATVALIIFSVIIVIGYEQFSNLLFTAIEDTQYGHYESFAEGGANILRVIVAAVPLVIAYLGREKLRSIFPSSDYIVNMALIGFIFMIISTQNWIFARFSIYFEIYTLILLSWLIPLFSKDNRKLVYYGIIICYFAYYYYENVMTLNIMYRSNFLM